MRSVLLTITFYYVELEQSYLKHKKFWQRAAIFNKSLNQLFTVKINYLLQMRILRITSCPFMPSKKVIGKLVSKKRLTYLLCALKRPHKYREILLHWSTLPTEQSRTVLMKSVYCCGFTLQSEAEYDLLGHHSWSVIQAQFRSNSVQFMPFLKYETRI